MRGDLTFAAGSVLAVEANAEGETDHVAVTGAASLNGSVFALTSDWAYRPQTSYTILSATGGRGQFGSVTSSLAFLDAGLSYDATDVTLNLERNDTAFNSVALRANGGAADRKPWYGQLWQRARGDAGRGRKQRYGECLGALLWQLGRE